MSVCFDEIRKPCALKGAHFRGSVNFVPVDVYQKEEQVRIILPDNSKYFKLELPGIMGRTYMKKIIHCLI